MKKINIVALAMLGLTATGGALVHADPAARPGPDVRVQVGHDPDDRYEGGVTIYHYPRPQHMNQVQVLAHRVEDMAHQARVKAQANRFRFPPSQRGILLTLRRLDNAADRFHAQVERYRQNPAQTESYFRELVRVYFRTQDSLRGVRGSWIIRRELGDLRNTMNQLMGSYGGSRYWIRDSYPNGGYRDQSPDYQDNDRDPDRDHDRNRDGHDRDGRDGYDRDGNHRP